MTKVYLVKEIDQNQIFSSKKKAIAYIEKQMIDNDEFSKREYGKELNYKTENINEWFISYTCDDSDFDIELDIYPLL